MSQLLPKIDLDGVRVTNASLEDMVRAARDASGMPGRCRTVVAVNAHTFREARRSPEYRAALNDSFISWADGTPITWAARIRGTPIPERVHGHDLMVRFLREPFRHFFYGSTPEVLEALRAALPGVQIAGMQSPPFTRRVEASDLSQINDSGADIVWIALGAPKQELWAELNRDRLKVPVAICVGAAFEILAGRFSRSPRWMQTLGLEWSWRLAQDPARLWRRYFSTNGYFLAFLMREAGRRMAGMRPTSPSRG
jgi:N-acetylglucosaminyldiphosphoundecaprenol N-acetyl-beta-D-mannosaminyltransferase